MNEARQRREELILEHLPLVRDQVGYLRKRLPVGMTSDDLRSCGVLGLIYAVDHHDPAKGPLREYASWRIEHAMRDGIRRITGSRRAVGNKAWVSLPDRERENKQCAAAAPSTRLAHVKLEAALAALASRERQVIQRYFFEDRTLLAIAQELGVSEGRACQIKAAALKKLRALVPDPAPRPAPTALAQVRKAAA